MVKPQRVELPSPVSAETTTAADARFACTPCLERDRTRESAQFVTMSHGLDRDSSRNLNPCAGGAGSAGKAATPDRRGRRIMAKKKKVRVDLRKNRQKPPRDRGWTREFHEHGYEEQAPVLGE